METNTDTGARRLSVGNVVEATVRLDISLHYTHGRDDANHDAVERKEHTAKMSNAKRRERTQRHMG